MLSESWVDITTSAASSGAGGTPGSVTPQIPAEEYLRLLREAQRESNQSSARVSLAGSRRDSPRSRYGIYIFTLISRNILFVYNIFKQFMSGET